MGSLVLLMTTYWYTSCLFFASAAATSGDTWAVELRPNANPQEVAKFHNMVHVQQRHGVRLPDGFYEFQQNSNGRSPLLDLLTSGHPDVVWAELQVARKRTTRSHIRQAIDDPLYGQQWHLHGTFISLNVAPVWQRGIDGRGVTIAIVDDGLDRKHQDIAPHYNAAGSIDINYGGFDPSPSSGLDRHGTSAGGVCCAAANNQVCGAGVAPGAGISGVKLIAKDTTDLEEAKGITYHDQINDISSNSWGPYDSPDYMEGVGRVTRRSIRESTQRGRHGLGMIFVWAAGNGGTAVNCNHDGYVNQDTVLAIGSINRRRSDNRTAARASYSERCSALLAVTPSSGGLDGQISTTTFSVGNEASCTTRFGGTSASAPQAAGIIALMLQIRPDLSWRDVKHVIVNSAVRTSFDPAETFDVNGAGFRHSYAFGFGRIDASACVDLARNWKLVPPYVTYKAPEVSFNQESITSRGGQIRTPLMVSNSGISFVEHVDVSVQISALRRNVKISLISPSGFESVLYTPMRSQLSFPEGWRLGSNRHWGEFADGQWTFVLEMDGRLGGANTNITGHTVQMTIYGHEIGQNHTAPAPTSAVPYTSAPSASDLKHTTSPPVTDSPAPLWSAFIIVLMVIGLIVIWLVLVCTWIKDRKRSSVVQFGLL